MPFCTQCGHQNPDDSKFCSNCGAALRAGSERAGGDTSSTTISFGVPEGAEDTSDLSAADQAAVEALPGGSALLIVRRGPNSGSRFLLDSDLTTAGRHPESDIFLDDVTVSRRHADFIRGDDGFHVRDVGSLNGTYVNRERIENILLAGGDEVQIGKYRLVFFAGHAGESAASDTADSTDGTDSADDSGNVGAANGVP
jgi:pSer/pThr/pTyr-binding forkhead associated (FHA) protein